MQIWHTRRPQFNPARSIFGFDTGQVYFARRTKPLTAIAQSSPLTKSLQKLRLYFTVEYNPAGEITFFRPKNHYLLTMPEKRGEFKNLRNELLKELDKTPLANMPAWQAAYKILLENDFWGTVKPNFETELCVPQTLTELKKTDPQKARETEGLIVFYLLNLEQKLSLEIPGYLDLDEPLQANIKKDYGIYSLAFTGEKELAALVEFFQNSQIPETKTQFVKGDKIGRYEIIAKLGEGAMGAVYKSQDPETGQIAALKFLNKDLISKPEEKRRFQREAQAVKIIKNKSGISETFETPVYFEIDVNGNLLRSVPYFASEFVQGKDLADLLKSQPGRQKPLAPKKAVEIMVQICQALKGAHDDGVYHLDLKPQHIIITPNGKAKILDFGIMRAILFALINIDKESLGTPCYASPEHLKKDTADQRADIYSLGVIFYEMLTGDVPTKDPDKYAFSLNEIEFDPAIPLDPQLKKIVLKMLEKDRKKRYQSADSLLKALNEYKNQAAEWSIAFMGQTQFPYLSGIEFIKDFEFDFFPESMCLGPNGELFMLHSKGLAIRDKDGGEISTSGPNWQFRGDKIYHTSLAINRNGEMYVYYKAEFYQERDRRIFVAKYNLAGKLIKETDCGEEYLRRTSLLYFSKMKSIGNNIAVLNKFIEREDDWSKLRNEIIVKEDLQIINPNFRIIRSRTLSDIFENDFSDWISSGTVILGVDQNKNIRLASEKTGSKIVKLDRDLKKIDKIGLPNFTGNIFGLEFDRYDNIFIDTHNYLKIYSSIGKYIGEVEIRRKFDASPFLTTKLRVDSVNNFVYFYVSDSYPFKPKLKKFRLIYQEQP